MTYAPPTGEGAKERLLDNLFGSSAVIEQQTGETTQSPVVLVEQPGNTLVPVAPGSAIASIGPVDPVAQFVVFALRSRAFCHEELEPKRLTNSGKFTGIASHVNRRTGFERHTFIDVSPSP
jgi:hypothetical protein